MNSQLFDRIGNWNPQLLRELRGKWKVRSIAVAVGVPLLACILLVLYQWQRLPSDNCVQNFGCAESMEVWWLEQFRLLLWSIPTALLSIGTFNLITDLTQESSRGTLNFIRLSPRSSWTIFMGKLIGAPILTYVSVLVLVPFHVVTGLMGGLPLSFFVSFYSLLFAFTFFIFSLAIVFSLLGSGDQKVVGIQAYSGAIFFSGLTLFAMVPLFMYWNLFTAWFDDWRLLMDGPPPPRLSIHWWYLSLTENSWFAHGFSLGNAILASAIAWQILKRRFHNPNAIIISKGLSYISSAYVEVFLIGFFLYPNFIASEFRIRFPIVFVYGVNFVIFFALTLACTPLRNSIKEWLNYRNPANLITDLLWLDKTPSPVSIGINLVITQFLLAGYLFSLAPGNVLINLGFLVIGLMILQWLLYALIYQIILLMSVKKPILWAFSILSSLMFVPAIFLAVIGQSPNKAGALWLMVTGLWSVLAFDSSVDSFGVAYLGLLGGIGLCTFVLLQRLQTLRGQGS